MSLKPKLNYTHCEKNFNFNLTTCTDLENEYHPVNISLVGGGRAAGTRNESESLSNSQ